MSKTITGNYSTGYEHGVHWTIDYTYVPKILIFINADDGRTDSGSYMCSSECKIVDGYFTLSDGDFREIGNLLERVIEQYANDGYERKYWKECTYWKEYIKK